MLKKLSEREYQRLLAIEQRQKERQARINERNKEKYDRIAVMLPKGMGDKLKAYAKECDVSVNALLVSMISDLLE